jgi:hypothetical protein
MHSKLHNYAEAAEMFQKFYNLVKLSIQQRKSNTIENNNENHQVLNDKKVIKSQENSKLNNRKNQIIQTSKMISNDSELNSTPTATSINTQTDLDLARTYVGISKANLLLNTTTNSDLFTSSEMFERLINLKLLCFQDTNNNSTSTPPETNNTIQAIVV